MVQGAVMARVEDTITEAAALAGSPAPDLVAPDQVVPDFAEQEPVAFAEPLVQRRSGFVAALSGGVMAAVAGFGLAQFVPDGWPLPDATAQTARITAQDATIAALQADVAALLARLPMADLEPQIAALSASVAALPDPAPFESRLAAMEAELATLAAMPADGSGASLAAIAALRAEVGRLTASGGGDVAALTAEAEARMKEATAQANRLKAEAEALAADGRVRAALGRLQAALDSGAPYAAALTDLGVEIPVVLQDAAETGLPTLGDLQDGFPDAARMALEVALKDNLGESWADRVAIFLRSQTGARSLAPREGTDPDAILSRAEAALQQGDVSLALTELAGLPEAAQAAMAPWRLSAGQRLEAGAAVAAIAGHLGE